MGKWVQLDNRQPNRWGCVTGCILVPSESSATSNNIVQGISDQCGILKEVEWKGVCY